MENQNLKRLTCLLPGPSCLYYTIPKHINNAISSGILEYSHRGDSFKKLYAETMENFRVLLSLPEDFNVAFTSSATEIWSHSLDNLVYKNSLHLIHGIFGERYYIVAKDKGYNATPIYSPTLNTAVDINSIPKKLDDIELITLTLNESSTGVYFSMDKIKKLKNLYPNALIGVDSVSDTPFTSLNYNDLDFFYLSVQKCFGLPSGLGVWVFNNKCIERTRLLDEKRKSTCTHRHLVKIRELSLKNQTAETPNILNIYLLGQVSKDMLDKGLNKIRDEISMKSALLYATTSQLDYVTPFAKNQDEQSKTVIVLETEKVNDLIPYFEKNGFILAPGYGKFKEQHIRIANFATHSIEMIQKVVNLLKAF